MPETNTVRVKRDTVITLSDQGGVNSYVIAYEPGDLSVDTPDTAVNFFLDRGRFGAVPSLRLGDEAPVTISFSAYLRNVSGADFATLLDIAQRFDGGYVESEWVSTLAGDVFTVTCDILISGADIGEADEQLRYEYCVVRASFADGDPSSVSVTLTSHQRRGTKV